MRRFGLFFFFLIIILLALIPSANRYWDYYGFLPWDTPPRRSVVAPPEYTSENVLDVIMPEQNSFEDDPEVGDGLILLDLAHDNNFKIPEIGALDGRLAARGFEFLEYRGGDLARQLRGVNAFVVIAPLANYSDEEIAAVNDFVADGGRLLLMGDPTRFTVDFILDDSGFPIDFNFITNELPLNDLANPFDISFEGDYLYNLTDEGNESNFRNIVVTGEQFATANELTDELETVVMYGAHSLEAGTTALPLIHAGETTYSSATDRAGGRLIGAITEDEQVLALGDFTFMSDPYYTTLDNERFIAHIADFLTAGQTTGRTYELADFPYFLDGTIELSYIGDVDLGPGAFDDIISLQNSFAAVDQDLTLTADPGGDNHVLHLGLYNQALTDDAVLALLADAGMELIIDPKVLTIAEQIELIEAEKAAEAEAQATAEAEADAAEESDEDESDETEEDEELEEVEEEEYVEIIQVIDSPLGRIEMAGTSLILLSEDDNGRYEIVVLAASKEGLENSTNRLLDLMPLDSEYALGDCLTTAVLALCPSDVSSEEVEPELITGVEQELPGNDADDEEDEADDDESDDADEEDPLRSSIDDLDGELVDQGTASLDEPFSGELALEEFHTWTYEGDEITVDILASADDSLDTVLSVYDDEGLLVEYADLEFSGADEQLDSIALSDGFLIVVNDLGLDDTGAYTVTVTVVEDVPEDVEEEEEDGEEPTETAGGLDKIFVYVDDDGTFLGDDEADTVDVTALIPDQYEVTTWQVSEQDDPLETTDFEGHDLIIWYTAEYREPEFTFTDEANLLFEILFEGGNLIIIGATPPTLEPAELVDLSAVRFADHPILDGLDITLDEPFPLEQTVSTSLFELVEDDLADGEEIFVFRADDDEYLDNAVGVSVDDEFTNTRFIILGLPLQAFDEGSQAQLIDNVLVWFGRSSSE